MKKFFLMAAFAAFAFAANAQTASTPTNAKAEKKECSLPCAPACMKGEKAEQGTAQASTEGTAALTSYGKVEVAAVKSVSKSKAKKACCADGTKCTAKAEKVTQ